MKKEKTEKQRKRIALAALIVFLAVTVFLCWKVGMPMVRLASDPEGFRQWLEQRKVGGLLIYSGMVFFQVLFAIIPGEPLEIAGGYAFGAVWGTIACLAAATVGSLLVFGLVRRFGIRLVELFYSEEKFRAIRFLQSSPKRNFLFLIIFMIPGTPKDLLCYFAGLTDIKFPVFLLVCSLGRIPSVITSTIGGDALGSKSYWFAGAVFGVTLLISAIGLLCYQQICKRHNQSKEPDEEQK